MEKSMLNKKIIVAITAMTLLAGGTAWAKVSQAEAEKLKGELTPMGAERAGNADGTIPAWDGGLTGVPAGVDYKGPKTALPDPFASDKILFKINAANIDQYEDNLTVAVAAFLKKHPEQSLDVYQTRRTAAAPQKVYDLNVRNATTIELAADRNGVINNGVNGGVPFPIPQSGEEVLFNNLLRWRGKGMEGRVRTAVVQPSGKINWGGNHQVESYPWNDWSKPFDGEYYKIVANYGPLPARRKGEIAVVVDPLSGARKAWQYLPGQRRVRRAPAISFDTPNPASSGLSTYDDVFIFNGSFERYDFKLVGKKEIYLPYNSYKFESASNEELFTPIMAGKNVSRWELHRYWVVEGTLKEGKRHAYGKRVLYVDEDSWTTLAQDAYDTKGNIWRGIYANAITSYSLPALLQVSSVLFDLTRDDYFIQNIYTGEDGSFPLLDNTKAANYFTPESARRLGRR
jgi:hypothetical protein